MYAIAAIQTASQTASRTRVLATSRSAASSASGRPQAWIPWMCASRVNVCVLKANIEPGEQSRGPVAVHAVTIVHVGPRGQRETGMSTMLNTSTGEPPSQDNGAPIRAGTMSGSENARVSWLDRRCWR